MFSGLCLKDCSFAVVSDRYRGKTIFFPESHWRTVPLEPKHEESGDAAAQSGQNVTGQGFPKLSLSLFVTAGKILLEIK